MADYIIDLGPEGGNRGGTVIAQGTPEEVAKNKKSYTGLYLKEYLKNGIRAVSHSPVYHQNEKPAYRVILRK